MKCSECRRSPCRVREEVRVLLTNGAGRSRVRLRRIRLVAFSEKRQSRGQPGITHVGLFEPSPRRPEATGPRHAHALKSERHLGPLQQSLKGQRYAGSETAPSVRHDSGSDVSDKYLADYGDEYKQVTLPNQHAPGHQLGRRLLRRRGRAGAGAVLDGRHLGRHRGRPPCSSGRSRCWSASSTPSSTPRSPGCTRRSQAARRCTARPPGSATSGPRRRSRCGATGWPGRRCWRIGSGLGAGYLLSIFFAPDATINTWQVTLVNLDFLKDGLTLRINAMFIIGARHHARRVEHPALRHPAHRARADDPHHRRA